MPINLPGKSSRLVAGHFARNYGGLVGNTLAQLAEEYDVSKGMMRTALRKARSLLARSGHVLTVPIRDDGYVVVISDEAMEAKRRMLSRLDPVTTELVRYAEDLAVLGEPNFFDDLISALHEAADEIVEDLLTSTP